MADTNKVCWYIIHITPSRELVVRDNILKMVENNGLQDQIFEVKVLEEEEIVEKNGKRKIVMKKKFPTYAFIKMIYSDHVYYKVTSIQGVTGFVGAGGRPEALSADEIRRMGLEKVKAEDLGINEGDQVRIIAGAFEGYYGEVNKIDAEASVVEVILHMFGKPTPIKLEFNQIERC
ncbi:MAG: transcription termination/antitermination factor NusG [Clostridia bacterium]|nr:transcription termination/antitermination factor NusG [Clostridia bacterium]